jgi:hypothetical protein
LFDGYLLLFVVALIRRHNNLVWHLDVCLERCHALHNLVYALIFYYDDG